jgi:DNA-directed RNA polymerase subunit RPC12/RpoP
VLGYVVMARSFRCPGCGSNLLVHAQFREPIGNWIEKALAYRACPKCGFHRPRS